MTDNGGHSYTEGMDDKYQTHDHAQYYVDDLTVTEKFLINGFLLKMRLTLDLSTEDGMSKLMWLHRFIKMTS